MRASLKKTLMTVTVLSTGFFVFSSSLAQADYKKPEIKKTVANTSFKQYPKLGEVKDDVNIALDLHQTAASLLAEKEQLKEYKESIEKYNEIERRLAQNIQCNISQLNEHFSDGSSVWKKVSAWAEDSASALLAEASDSLSDDESSSQLAALEAKVNAGDSSEDSSTSVTTASDSQYSGINENTSTEEAMAMVEAGSAEAEAATTDMDMNEVSAYGKVRWDVGNAVLKDIYAYPKKWGTLTKAFSPWVDQKHVYDVYLDKFYAELEKHYTEVYYVTNEAGERIKQTRPFPARPKMTPLDSYLPEDHYNGEVPEIKVSSVKYNHATASVDDKWCGSTNGKKNECTRINKGTLYQKHMAYVAALQNYSLQTGYSKPKMDPPYLPQHPLPPWRETVYIVNVEKQIPQMASELPDPWFKVTQSIDNFTPNGELSNLVERHGNTVRYRPEDYNAETGEINNNSDGTPRMPIPLMTNRISSYLMLVSAKEEQEPIKDRAIASIKEVNENVIATLEKAGYTVPNPSTFDLSNEADYNMTLQKISELQKEKINSAKAKMENLRASFGGNLLPSVVQILEEETTTMDALQKDTEFLIGVTRDNAPEINSLILTAVADATANQTYKDNVEAQMEESTPIPPVGCPVL